MRPAENDASLSREITKFLKGLMTFSFAGLADILINVVPAVIDSKLNQQLSKPQILGRVKRVENANDKYIKILKKNFPKNILKLK